MSLRNNSDSSKKSKKYSSHSNHSHHSDHGYHDEHSSSHHHSHHSSSYHSSSHHSGGHHHGSSSHHSSSGYHRSSSSSHGAASNDYYYNTSSAEQKKAEEEKMELLSKKYSTNSTENPDQEAKSPDTDLATNEAIKSLQKKINKKNKKKKASKIILGIIIFIVALMFIAAVALLIMINSGKKKLLDYSDTNITAVDDAVVEDDGKTVKYKGKIYKLNENITSIVCMGVDKDKLNQNGVAGSSGQADTIMVVAFDTELGMAKLLPIPRDTITEIDVYAKDNSFLRTEKTQICLSFAYGDGGKTSCENVISSVQKLMFGIPMKSYAALDLKGIAPLNDAVGGVVVVPTQSFGDKFEAGKPIHLKGQMAMDFVRSRDTTKVDSNLTRMNNQMTYVKAFTQTAVSQVKEDVSLVTDLYNKAMNYSYTNIGLDTATYIASRFVSVYNGEFVNFSVPGKMISGEDGFSEYIIDEEAFYETILSIYYNVIGTY